MGFKSIDSTEKLGDVSLSSGDAPRHTVEGHERCAYHKYDCLYACSHGSEVVGGALYSEDYVRQLKIELQKVVASYPAYPGNLEEYGRLRDLVSD